MRNLLLPGALLALALPGRAQAPARLPATYAEARDSLWQRAARLRRAADARTADVRPGFAGLLGTRRRILSYALLRPGQPYGPANPYRLLKSEVAKHKTRNARVQKVRYYDPGKVLRLYEYYEDGELVQLELTGYLVPDGPAPQQAVCALRWTRGDYLRLTLERIGQPTERRAYAATPPLPPAR